MEMSEENLDRKWVFFFSGEILVLKKIKEKEFIDNLYAIFF